MDKAPATFKAAGRASRRAAVILILSLACALSGTVRAAQVRAHVRVNGWTRGLASLLEYRILNDVEATAP